jgi:hypothetical protein
MQKIVVKCHDFMEPSTVSASSTSSLTLCPLLPTLKVLEINLGLFGISKDPTIRLLQEFTVGSRDPKDKLFTGSQNPSILKLKGVVGEWE